MSTRASVALGDATDARGPLLARWLRTIISTLVDRGDVPSALEHAIAARTTIERRAHSYPADEVDWLLGFSWDLGQAQLSAGDGRSARGWAEVALGVLPFSRQAGTLSGMVRSSA